MAEERPEPETEATRPVGPCPVSSLATDWAIPDDQIAGGWVDVTAEPGLALALEALRNAVMARAVGVTAGSVSGAAFQAWLVGLHVSIADDPELDEDARTRHLRLAAEGARHLLRYMTTLRLAAD